MTYLDFRSFLMIDTHNPAASVIMVSSKVFSSQTLSILSFFLRIGCCHRRSLILFCFLNSAHSHGASLRPPVKQQAAIAALCTAICSSERQAQWSAEQPPVCQLSSRPTTHPALHPSSRPTSLPRRRPSAQMSGPPSAVLNSEPNTQLSAKPSR